VWLLAFLGGRFVVVGVLRKLIVRGNVLLWLGLSIALLLLSVIILVPGAPR
jgi:hypothetical protein